MSAQKKVLNPQVFLEFMCYAVFAGLMLYLVSTGKYQAYVTPRMVPYFYFTSAVMAVWALGGLFRLFRPQHKTRTAHCFVLAIPILLLLLPHTPINAADLSSGYLNGSALAALPGKSLSNPPKGQGSPNNSNFNVSAGSPAGDPSQDSTKNNTKDNTNAAKTNISTKNPSANNMNSPSSTDTAAPNNSAAATSGTVVSDSQTNAQANGQADGSASELPGLDVKNKKITVANHDFSLWISELCANTEKYKGYTVVMTGFVFKDQETFQKDQFVPARLMMSCCAADLAPAGLLCKYDKAVELKKDSWVTVEGTLFIGKTKYGNQEYDEPQISVTKITPAQKVDGYVYPY